MLFPNPLCARWPRGTGTEPTGGVGPRTCLTPSHCSGQLLCEDKGAAWWCLAGAQPGSPGGIPGPTLLAITQQAARKTLPTCPRISHPEQASCPFCPLCPTGYDPGRPHCAYNHPSGICSRKAAQLRNANSTTVLEHEWEAQPPPWAAGARPGSSQEGRQKPRYQYGHHTDNWKLLP